jgi:hypothetical protein
MVIEWAKEGGWMMEWVGEMNVDNVHNKIVLSSSIWPKSRQPFGQFFRATVS